MRGRDRRGGYGSGGKGGKGAMKEEERAGKRKRKRKTKEDIPICWFSLMMSASLMLGR